MRRWQGLIVLGLLALLLAGCGPLVDPDSTQERATTPAERISAGHSLGQTLVSHRSRLTAVDLLLAVYPPGQGDEAGDLVLHLRRSPDDPRDLATARAPIAGLQHNSYFRFAFPPQPDSLGRQYYLLVEATTKGPARATIWSAGVDAYPEGVSYRDGRPAAGQLAFRAYYDYDAQLLAADLLGALRRRGWLFLPALAALLLPGFALQRWLLPGLGLDAAEAMGLWLGLGLAVAPVLLLLATVVGLRLGPAAAVGYVALCAAAGLGRAWLDRRARPRAKRPGALSAPTEGSVEDLHPRAPGSEAGEPIRLRSLLLSPAAGAFAAAAGALVLRYVHARDLALPMWGDSVHHALIAGLIAEQGRVPVDYGPLAPIQPFTYHFGFHLQVVLLRWLAGVEVARGVLFVGQLLSGLMVFPTYLLASKVTGDRRAGLVAGVVVGLVSVMPAYSITWGRYPQLAGLAVLPAAVYLADRVLDGEKPRWAGLVAATIASAGLVLTHPRVALLYGCYLAAHLVVAHWPVSVGAAASATDERRRQVKLFLGPWLRGGLLALLTAVLVAPWLVRLSSSRVAGFMVTPGPVPAFSFPVGILTTGFDRYLLAAAIAGVGLSLMLRRRAGVEVALWVGLALVAANVRWLGLPFYTMLSDDALAIMLFLPIAVLDGLLAVCLARLVRLDVWPRPARLAPAALLLALAVWGGRNLAGIVNPVCILATAADVEAIRWVAAHTAPDAAFLVNSFRWQGDIHMGSDGGYWLSALAGRRTSLPPLPYDHGAPGDVARIRRLAEAVEARPADPGALLALMRANGLTHVFVGARGGPIDAQFFKDAPGFRVAYTNGRAWVFEAVSERGPAGP